MSHNDKFIGQLEDYLETFDGTTPLPDRVRDAIRAELPSARQVQPRTGLLGVFTMLSNASAGARLGLAAAAVVVAVALGAAFLNSRPGTAAGVAPTPTTAVTTAPSAAPTPVPTSSPTSAPSGAVSPPWLAVGTSVACDSADTANSCLAAGTYQLSGGGTSWPVMVTLDLPAGWSEWRPGPGWDAVLLNADSGWGIVITTVGDVYRDPCDSSKGAIPAAQVNTPEKLAAEIAAWPGFTTTAAQPVTVDGHRALELRVAKKANTKMCGPGPQAVSNRPGWGVAWLSASGTVVDAYPFANGSAYRTTIRIVDTGNGLLVIRASDFPNTSPNETGAGLANTPDRHAKDQATLRAILNSVKLTPTSP
jgi:hypothetical protein